MNIRVAPTMDEANDNFLKEYARQQNKSYSDTLNEILTEIRTRRYYTLQELICEKGRLYLDYDMQNKIETKQKVNNHA